MRIFHISGEEFSELSEPPTQRPVAGYLWVGCARREFELHAATLQAWLQQ